MAIVNASPPLPDSGAPAPANTSSAPATSFTNAGDPAAPAVAPCVVLRGWPEMRPVK
jgi:hypothetical protein